MKKALIIGSGAAGLAAAVRLKCEGVEDVTVVTEGVKRSTSINTGSDKQTYYKLGLYGGEADSPEALARTLFNGGSMHGDTAMVEAAYSARAFLHLVNLGVPFPSDEYGQFIGYKTDHDPSRRATSCGPYTSKLMCQYLAREAASRGVEILEGRLVTDLLVERGRCHGAVAVNERTGAIETHLAENTVFAVGGPGGIYATSVYPPVHLGAIGVALKAGALAQGLPESQYGLASIKFRWNVSGTYMQVLPRFVSTDASGGDPREFLHDTFTKRGTAESLTFLKGYQWPFDVAKAETGSSQIDLLVYEETVVKGRRVWLDFRANPKGLLATDSSKPSSSVERVHALKRAEGADFTALDPEAHDYLAKSSALFGTPVERLAKMNPGAIALYADHGIDIKKEMLEVAVCAQHNNGGLAADAWCRSPNIAGLYIIGEVGGTHGVTRPGGSALNAGQVAGFRAAEAIALAPDTPKATLKKHKQTATRLAKQATAEVSRLLNSSTTTPKASKSKKGLPSSRSPVLPSHRDWKRDLAELRARMTRCGAHLRDHALILEEEKNAAALYRAVLREGYPPELKHRGLNNLQLALSAWVYLSAIRFQIESGVGSRGSALVIKDGQRQPEDRTFRERVLETRFDGKAIRHRWVERRPLPDTSSGWFEQIWAQFRERKKANCS